MLKTILGKIRLLYPRSDEKAKLHIEYNGAIIGSIKSMAYDIKNEVPPLELYARSVIFNENFLFSSGCISPECQWRPVNIIIEEDGKITGKMMNCWWSDGELSEASEWHYEYFEPQVVFADIA